MAVINTSAMTWNDTARAFGVRASKIPRWPDPPPEVLMVISERTGAVVHYRLDCATVGGMDIVLGWTYRPGADAPGSIADTKVLVDNS